MCSYRLKQSNKRPRARRGREYRRGLYTSTKNERFCKVMKSISVIFRIGKITITFTFKIYTLFDCHSYCLLLELRNPYDIFLIVYFDFAETVEYTLT